LNSLEDDSCFLQVLSKATNHTLLRWTVPLEQPGVKCLAQGRSGDHYTALLFTECLWGIWTYNPKSEKVGTVENTLYGTRCCIFQSTAFQTHSTML